MINFERHKDPKEAMDIGGRSWVDYRLHDFLQANAEDLDTPIIIYGLKITSNRNLNIIFEFVEKEKDLLVADRYCWKLFQDLSLGHIFEREDSQLQIKESKNNSLIYEIKDIYKKVFIPGRKYEAI